MEVSAAPVATVPANPPVVDTQPVIGTAVPKIGDDVLSKNAETFKQISEQTMQQQMQYLTDKLINGPLMAANKLADNLTK
jgi:hypothetical protein